jgi:hypothetical protein
MLTHLSLSLNTQIPQNQTKPNNSTVWWGALTGIAVSIVFGGIFAGVYYAAKTLLFQGTAKAIFQVRVGCCVAFVACKGNTRARSHQSRHFGTPLPNANANTNHTTQPINQHPPPSKKNQTKQTKTGRHLVRGRHPHFVPRVCDAAVRQHRGKVHQEARGGGEKRALPFVFLGRRAPPPCYPLLA